MLPYSTNSFLCREESRPRQSRERVILVGYDWITRRTDHFKLLVFVSATSVFEVFLLATYSRPISIRPPLLMADIHLSRRIPSPRLTREGDWWVGTLVIRLSAPRIQASKDPFLAV